MPGDILIDADGVRRVLAETINDTLAKSGSYGPLKDIVHGVIGEYKTEITATCREALAGITTDPKFAAMVREELMRKVAKTLVAELGGLVDQTVNTFRRDPKIKAEMIEAIERIIEGAK